MLKIANLPNLMDYYHIKSKISYHSALGRICLTGLKESAMHFLDTTFFIELLEKKRMKIRANIPVAIFESGCCNPVFFNLFGARTP